MAADVIVSVIGKLGSLLIQEGMSLRGGLYDQVQWLEREMIQMRSYLRDAEEKQATSENVRTWLADIQRIACDAENLIDNFNLQKEQQVRRGFYKRYSLAIHDLYELRKFRKQIEMIKINISSISDRRLTYGIENIEGERGMGSSSSTDILQKQRQITSHSRETMPIVGLSKDIKLLEEQLIHGDLKRKVISIVGMGGLGKTTLAKSLYHSNVVRRHFHCFAWVYVSQRFEPRELLLEIKKQIEPVLKIEANVVEESLFPFLENMKYLIVIDDVWSKDVWTSIEGNFPNSELGSRILLTTRRTDVALHAEPTNPPHEINLLDEEDSWKLFTNNLYKVEKKCPQYLEEHGKRIVGKCGGLPLAIKLIGGLLSTKEETLDAWSRVFDSLPWHLNQEVQYSSILAMSYNDLPPYLKPCFRYFATFPEGFQIPVKRLIRLWISEGLLHQRAEEELEDVGKDYIVELADRNIIQVTNKDKAVNRLLSTEEEKKKKITQAVTKEKSGGRNRACSMHDLVRDHALSIAKETDFLDVYVDRESNSSNLNNKLVRRLAMHFDSKDSTTWEGSFPNLHSLSVFDLREGERQKETEIGYFLHRSIVNKGLFELLKVLDLEDIYKPRLPKALGKLIHLRYLGLRRTWLKTLPTSVANLFNLETLDLKYTEVEAIPSAIWGMQKLRHLYLNGGVHSRVLIETTSNNKFESLRKLRTLCGIFLGPENCVTDRLEKLTKIRKLEIEGDLMSHGQALGYWIKKLTKLEHLKLRSTVGEQPSSSSTTATSDEISRFILLGNLRLTKLHLEGKLKDARVLASLMMLSNLTLVGTQIKNFDPMELLGDLPTLTTLRLWYNSYMGRVMNCRPSCFPKLEILEVCWLDRLEWWRVEEGAMPNLRELEINKCKKLIKLPDGLKFLTNVKELRLPAMSERMKSRVLPYTGEDWYKIQHIPFISPPLFNDAAPSIAPASTSSSLLTVRLHHNIKSFVLLSLNNQRTMKNSGLLCFALLLCLCLCFLSQFYEFLVWFGLV